MITSLQRSVGNAAVSSMLGAGRRALGEPPVPVSDATQRSIDELRGSGVPLGGPLRDEMESLVGRDLDRVQLHGGDETDALATELGARAFTQGRDVFLRSDRLPVTDGGRETLTHELQHVAQGAPEAGAVVRDDDEAMEGLSQGELMDEYVISMQMPDWPSETSVNPSSGGGPPPPYVSTGHTPPPVAPPKVEQTFDFSIWIDGKREAYAGLTQDQVMKELNSIWLRLHGLLDLYRGWHQELVQNREDHKIVGFWADKLGNGDPPDIGIWSLLGRQELSTAEALVEESDATLSAKADTDWAYTKTPEYAQSHGMTEQQVAQLNLFAGGEQKAKEQAKETLQAQHVSAAVNAMAAASKEIEVRRRRVFYYKEGQQKGAARGIAGTKVAIGVLAATTAGAVAGEVEGGLITKAVVAGGVQSGLGMFSETATQTGEMFYGDREWGAFDVDAIKKTGKREAISGFAGALVAGKLTQLADAGVARYVAPILEDAGINLDSEGLQIVAKGGRDWVVSQIASPANTVVNTALDVAIDGKAPPKNWGEFYNRVVDDLAQNAEMSGVLVTLGHGIQSSHGVTPPGGEPTTPKTAGEPTPTPTETAAAAGGVGGGGGAPPPAPPGPPAPAPGPAVDPYARTVEIPAQQPGAQRGNAAIGSARTLRPGELAAQTGDTASMPAAEAPVDAHARTAEVPAQQPDAQRGGAAAGSARTLRPGELEAQTGDTATMTAQEAPTTQMTAQEIGTAPTQQTSAQPDPGEIEMPEDDLGTARTQEQPAQGAPEGAPPEGAPVAPPPGPGPLHAVEPADATRMLWDSYRAKASGQPFRIVNGMVEGEVQATWERDYHQTGPAPAAWVDASGTLVVDSARVTVPIHSADVPAPGTAGPTPSPDQMIVPPERAAQAPAAADPAGAAPDVPAGPQTGASTSGPMPAAEPAPAGPRTAGDSDVYEAPPEPPRMRAGEVWALEIDHVVSDEVEATQLLESKDVRPLILDGMDEPERLQELWKGYGGEGAVPAAWLDNAGLLIVDASRMPGVLDMVSHGTSALAGPVAAGPDPVAELDDVEPSASEEAQATKAPGYSRDVARIISDPAEASQLFFEADMAGEVSWIVKDPTVLRDIWNGSYQQQGDPPVAWVNGAGVLTVDALRVDIVRRSEGSAPK